MEPTAGPTPRTPRRAGASETGATRAKTNRAGDLIKLKRPQAATDPTATGLKIDAGSASTVSAGDYPALGRRTDAIRAGERRG